MYYANLKGKFYDGREGDVLSSVKGTQIVLNCELLGRILHANLVEWTFLIFKLIFKIVK